VPVRSHKRKEENKISHMTSNEFRDPRSDAAGKRFFREIHRHCYYQSSTVMAAMSRSARISLLLVIDVIFFFIELIVGKLYS
jgi:hypothetical protein